MCILDCNGTGILFFNYFQIWHKLNLKSMGGKYPFYWVYENMYNMDEKTRDTMSG